VSQSIWVPIGGKTIPVDGQFSVALTSVHGIH
jgi:hypothetical protein